MFDACTPPPVRSPSAVTEDPSAPKSRSDELADPTIGTIGEHAPVAPAEDLDHGSAVVDRIVAIARTARTDRDDAPIPATNQDLGIGRVTVVLGLRGPVVVSRRDQGAIDDPGPSAIERWICEQRREPRRHVRDDAVDAGPGQAGDRGELPDGEVGPQRRAREGDAHGASA